MEIEEFLAGIVESEEGDNRESGDGKEESGISPESSRGQDDSLNPDNVNSQQDEKTSSDSEHVCSDCGNPVFRKGTRGRWPKFCENCKKPRSGGSPKRESAKTNTSNKRLDNIADNLARNITLIAMGAGMFAPTFGYVVSAKAPGFAGALVELAKDKPHILAALEASGRIGPISEIISFLLSAGLAAAVDFNKIPMDHMACGLTGVTNAYIKTHGNNGTVQNASDNAWSPNNMPLDMPLIPMAG